MPDSSPARIAFPVDEIIAPAGRDTVVMGSPFKPLDGTIAAAFRVNFGLLEGTFALDRTNHTGTQSADTLTDGTVNKAFLASERTKLAGIATGATANSSNATLLARANHTGTQAQSTVVNLVSDLAAKQAADATLTALAGKTVSGSGNVVLQSYVDGLIAGLKFKASVRVATTANGALSTAFENGDFVDGFPLVTGNRILLKNQSTAAENGIYTVNASGAPTRATDFDAWAEIPGALMAVEVGTVNADTAWLCTSDSGGTLDSTAINFTRFGAGGLLAANNLSDVASRATALNNLLPSQTSATGKVFTSDGTNGGWQTPSGGTAISTPRVYHVQTDGNNSAGDGSQGTPFQTGTKAYEVGVLAGQPFSIHFGGGDFGISIQDTSLSLLLTSISGEGYFPYADDSKSVTSVGIATQGSMLGGNGGNIAICISNLAINLAASGADGAPGGDGNTATPGGNGGNVYLYGTGLIVGIAAYGGAGDYSYSENGGGGGTVSVSGMFYVCGTLSVAGGAAGGMGGSPGADGVIFLDGCNLNFSPTITPTSTNTRCIP